MKIFKILLGLPVMLLATAAHIFLMPYFIVERKRKHWIGAKLPMIMFWLNVIFAWTLVGWLVLLVIAITLPE